MTTIKIKKGAGTPSGLTFGELAYDVTNKKLFIGITGGNALLANTDGGVASFNGLTGAVTGVTTGVANTFGPLQSFTSGISSAGGTFSSQTRFLAGITVAGGATFGTDISVFGIRVGRGNQGATAGGDTNLAVGANALNSVIPNPGSFAGIQNLAFGTSALQNTTSGGYNSAFGTEALFINTSGGGNIAFGVHALRLNTSGSENCAFGGGPMYQNTTGAYNTAIGSLAYYYKSTGSYNVALGFQAGYNFGTPSSGNAVTSATNCTLIGSYATPLASGTSNEIVIGYNAIGKGSNTVSIGNSSITSTHLTGIVNIPSGLSAAGATFSGPVSAGTITASLNGNASTATTLQTTRAINEVSFNGSTNITINQLYREDNRTISPSEGTPGYSKFAFTSWNNDSGAPYADSIHFRTYTDASGGDDNLLMFRKNAIGMRLWQQAYGSALAYSAYKDVAFIQDSVASFNGLTGAVTGVTTGIANTFGPLQSFTNGISAAGATFSGDIAVNGGDITTTSATATLYNTTATTVNIGNAANTVNLMGATANTQTGIGSMCYVKTGRTTTTTTAKQEIFRYPTVTASTEDRFFADIIITANYGGGLAGSIGSQITKMLVATSYNTAINHTEYGNVNTSGNLAVYTAEISVNDVIIYATPTNGFTTVFNTYATLIKGSYGANTEE